MPVHFTFDGESWPVRASRCGFQTWPESRGRIRIVGPSPLVLEGVPTEGCTVSQVNAYAGFWRRLFVVDVSHV